MIFLTQKYRNNHLNLNALNTSQISIIVFRVVFNTRSETILNGRTDEPIHFVNLSGNVIQSCAINLSDTDFFDLMNLSIKPY